MNELNAVMPQHGAVLRNRMLAWPDERLVSIAGPERLESADAGWIVDRVELTSDGQFVAAWGDVGTRMKVWRVDGLTLVLDVSSGARPHMLTGGLANVGTEPCAFTAVRDESMTITALVTGNQRGRLSTTGLAWFHIGRVLELSSEHLAVRGHRDGEGYDTVVVLRSMDILDEGQALQMALTQPGALRDWGYQLAIGPVSDAEVAIMRDREWEPDDMPDPNEAFRGIIVHALADGSVSSRLPYSASVTDDATIGGDDRRIAIACKGYVDIVTRARQTIERRAALAFDPYRMDIAREDQGCIVIERLG